MGKFASILSGAQLEGGAVEQLADRGIELRLRRRPTCLQQRIGLDRRVGLAQELVLQEVAHRLGDLPLLLNLRFLGLDVFLLGLDLNEPFARQLLPDLGTLLLLFGDPPLPLRPNQAEGRAADARQQREQH